LPAKPPQPRAWPRASPYLPRPRFRTRGPANCGRCTAGCSTSPHLSHPP
jgi:hypothetical protein